MLRIILVLVAVAIIFILVLAYACCVAAGRRSKEEEELLDEWFKANRKNFNEDDSEVEIYIFKSSLESDLKESDSENEDPDSQN